jgi:formylglycine-generating enzyme required for sulfatase activity
VVAGCSSILGIHEIEPPADASAPDAPAGADVAGGDSIASLDHAALDAVSDVTFDATTDAPPPSDSGASGDADAAGEAGPVEPPSCQGLAATCGASQNEDCCTSLTVPGGSFIQSTFDPYLDAGGTPSPATVSTFRLDKFKVTVGRFRNFIAATLAGWYPTLGSGKHVHLNDGGGIPGEPGWAAAFGVLPSTTAQWSDQLTGSGCAPWVPAGPIWTDTPQGNEDRPLNCVSWPEAYAFCIWDGGFLPTDAERTFAAAGGDEERYFPWSVPPDAATIDWTYASYDCTGDPQADGAANCYSIGDYTVVGTKPKGNGRWGHADLAGIIWDRTLDCFEPLDGSTCIDCTHDVLCNGGQRVERGGDFATTPDLLSTNVKRADDAVGHIWIGFRCARPP